MGKGGGGNTPSNSTQQTVPWAGQQPYLTDIFRQAQNLYRQGPQEYYPDSTVVAFGNQTTDALQRISDRAVSGAPQETAFGDYLSRQLGQSNIDPTSVTPYAAQAAAGIPAAQQLLISAGRPTDLGTAASIAGVSADPYQTGTNYSPSGPLRDTFELNGTVPFAARRQLADTSRGAFLGSNPYLDDVFKNAAFNVKQSFRDDILPSLNATFGKGSRSNSGIQALLAGRAAGDMAQELRGLASDIYAPAYEAERGRQISAAGQLGNLGLGSGGLDIQAKGLGVREKLGLGNLDVTQRLGLGQQDIARRQLAGNIYTGGLSRGVQAGSQLGNLGIGGLGQFNTAYGTIGQNQFRAGTLVPSLSALQYGNLDRYLGVGNIYDDQAQRELNDKVARFNFGQQAPYSALNQYASSIYGLPAGFGTTTTNYAGQQGSRFSGGLGGALTGAALGSKFGLPGTILGGLGGGLLGIFG